MVLPKMPNEAVEKLLKGLNINTLWGHSIPHNIMIAYRFQYHR